ncbi:FAD/NAD(P)-binding domain-containing protein [Punctularia strigosozonata HHB-11173 SS5]|uniref:FAD/NAD(P)-binding domain-containing protein n=1 Tax=Punctularia strigosozonata (strain HHB-11173) TaxID=741275 RepID=R7S357_PUNST|nr:FAD/NAD(P)-binding domain-containing protein [Punctularia strigosozonata HHB-11173 SS5]EIN04269.1 FAD/NAD(P)-binding domain-containing protein [Punctularia strigosozonata HHB-11173 SS5]
MLLLRSFAELGAGISLGPNSLEALELLGLGDTFKEIANMSEENPLWFRVLDGRTGTHVTDVSAVSRSSRQTRINPYLSNKLHIKGRHAFVHRARLLERITEHLPPNVHIYFSCNVVKVETIHAPVGYQRTSFVHVTFQRPSADGTPRSQVFEASAAIACDGIRSNVRECLKPYCGGRVRYTGTYLYRGLLDMHDAIKAIGERARISTQRMGLDRQISALPIDGGKTLSVSAYVSDRSLDPDQRIWDAPRWVIPGSTQQMLAAFNDFGEDAKSLLKLVKKADQWALHELVPPKIWTAERVTLLGDAAHAGQPFNGAGVGQAFEDAYVLTELMAHPACNASTIPRFLQAYEDVRRERARLQQAHSRVSGEIYQYRGPMGDDTVAIAAEFQDRFDWIWHVDLRADVAEALQKLKSAGVVA